MFISPQLKPHFRQNFIKFKKGVSAETPLNLQLQEKVNSETIKKQIWFDYEGKLFLNEY